MGLSAAATDSIVFAQIIRTVYCCNLNITETCIRATPIRTLLIVSVQFPSPPKRIHFTPPVTMSTSNVLAAKDINASLHATTDSAPVKDVKSMEYHRQVLQSKMEQGE